MTNQPEQNVDLSTGDPEYIIKGSELIQLCFHHIQDTRIMSIESDVRSRHYINTDRQPWCYPGCNLVDRAKRIGSNYVLDELTELVSTSIEPITLYQIRKWIKQLKEKYK